MRVEFWGVRGTAATPDTDKLRYGANTTCTIVTCESMPHHYFVLDAGTGLARFGNTLKINEDYTATVLLSHLHLYHIIGFQFTPLAYSPRCKTHVIGPSTRNIAMETVFDHIMAPSYSPVYGLANLMAEVRFEEVTEEIRQVGTVRIAALPFTNSHDTHSWGYRLENGSSSIAYLTDALVRTSDDTLEATAIQITQGVDLLIVGAFDPEHERRHLTTYRDAIDLAHYGDIKRILFSHHHPDMSDSDLDHVQTQIRRENPDLDIGIAAEGMVIEI